MYERGEFAMYGMLMNGCAQSKLALIIWRRCRKETLSVYGDLTNDTYLSLYCISHMTQANILS